MNVVMFAWGNPSRGDDAVGPWFADHFRSRSAENFTLVEEFQLQVEHLLDVGDGDLLLFVDAGAIPAENFSFEEIVPEDNLSHTSHALTPAQLLGYYGRVFRGESPPPGFQLTVPGEHFELGHPLSAATEASCYHAAQFVTGELLRRPDVGHWRAQVNSRHMQGRTA